MRIAIVGDIKHSRVARSLVAALKFRHLLPVAELMAALLPGNEDHES